VVRGLVTRWGGGVFGQYLMLGTRAGLLRPPLAPSSDSTHTLHAPPFSTPARARAPQTTGLELMEAGADARRRQRAARDAMAPLVGPWVQVIGGVLELPFDGGARHLWGVKLEALRLLQLLVKCVFSGGGGWGRGLSVWGEGPEALLRCLNLQVSKAT